MKVDRTIQTRRRSLRLLTVVSATLALLATTTGSARADYQRPGLTERVSVASGGGEANGRSQDPAISADGRYVAFQTQARNLAPGAVGGEHIFLRDRATGLTERISVTWDGKIASNSSQPSISADGRYVAFHSFGIDLVPGDTNGQGDVFVRDREAGTTERVSVASDGSQANESSLWASISADGRHVVFISWASNLVPGDTNRALDVFVHDRETRVTERVSVASGGAQATLASSVPSISGDGRYVAFASQDPTLAPGDRDLELDVFVRDREADTTELVSVSSDGTDSNERSTLPSISADGRYVAFESEATNLVPSDTNGVREVFVHDRDTATTERVSIASDGGEANGESVYASISPDGRYVGFHSVATNLVPGDTSEKGEIFVHDRATGATERLVVTPDGEEANGQSIYVAFAADGRHIAFDTDSTNVVPGDTNGVADVFVRDRGPAAGVIALDAGRAGDHVEVSGSASFSGMTVASAVDDTGDGVGPAGAEIVEASIVHRPEQEDLMLRMRLASLPGLTVGGAPGILYRWSFAVAGTSYEVRGARIGPTPQAPTADPHFGLYECSASCTEVGRVTGGLGTAGADVRVAVPLGMLGAESTVPLTDVIAVSAAGAPVSGAVATIDEVELPDGEISAPRVELGSAQASTPADEVAYTTVAEMTEGRFTATLSFPPAEGVRIWARACLGERCEARSFGVRD